MAVSQWGPAQADSNIQLVGAEDKLMEPMSKQEFTLWSIYSIGPLFDV